MGRTLVEVLIIRESYYFGGFDFLGPPRTPRTLSPKPPNVELQGLMLRTFGMACGVWPTGSTKFSYDRILNMGSSA